MRSVDMTDGICFAGLDVHARKTAAAAVQLGSGEVFKAQIAGSPVEAIGWLRSLPGPVRAVYEAGPTGFGLARAARAAGVEVVVCAPGAIPRQPGDRIKTDTRDALKLARLLAAGQLREVRVPEPELEALRDLVRAREDLRGDLMGARHRISKLLLRRGLAYPGLESRGRRNDISRGWGRSIWVSRWPRRCSASTWPATRSCLRGATAWTA
jgi:transposase